MIPKLVKIYKPETSLTQAEVKEHLQKLKGFEFYENESQIHGGFVNDYGWANRFRPMFISVGFLFRRNRLDRICIKPTFIVYLFMMGLPLVIIGILAEAKVNNDINNPLEYGIAILGVLVIYSLIRYFTKLKVKATKKKIQL
ncbi:hypothetical protein [Kordia sp.]|uniref:hypothetical protein n=1 Tax=Kordia sp. TaxID=1965332 RepID=UPI003D6AB553